MSNQMNTIKLNRFTSYLQQPTTYLTQSPAPSPNDLISIILFHLKQWLNVIPNLFNSFCSELNHLSPPQTLSRWFNTAAHWLPFVVGGALLLCFLCCCLPAILSCITWVLVACFSLIRGFFMLLFNACRSVFRCLFCCGHRSVKMMKAPGRGGNFLIPRAGFESNPAAYFRGLRASAPLY